MIDEEQAIEKRTGPRGCGNDTEYFMNNLNGAASFFTRLRGSL